MSKRVAKTEFSVTKTNPSGVSEVFLFDASGPRLGIGKAAELLVTSKYGLNCFLCGYPIDQKAPSRPGSRGWENGLAIKSLIPFAAGGPRVMENVRPCHAQCDAGSAATVKHAVAFLSHNRDYALVATLSRGVGGDGWTGKWSATRWYGGRMWETGIVALPMTSTTYEDAFLELVNGDTRREYIAILCWDLGGISSNRSNLSEEHPATHRAIYEEQISKLTDKQKVVTIYEFYKSMGIYAAPQRISDEMNIPIRTVHDQIYRAKKEGLL